MEHGHSSRDSPKRTTKNQLKSTRHFNVQTRTPSWRQNLYNGKIFLVNSAKYQIEK
jgi:hypothetical protein